MSEEIAVAVADLLALAHGYASAVDAKDGDALRALFTPDGTLTSHVGREPRAFAGDGLVALVGELAAFDRTLHEIVRHAFDEGDSHATGEIHGVAHHIDAAGTDLVIEVRYDDTYRCEDGRWLIATRVVRRA